MKNLFILLSLGFFLNSCSSDDSNSNDSSSGEELDLTHYILKYPSGNVTQHNFDGSKGINAERNGKEIVSFEYNTNNKISKYIKYDSNGDIEESYTFNYDSSGKMISVDEFHDNPFLIPENFTRTLTYEGNSIKTTFPKDDTVNYNEEFILNDEGLIKEYIKLDFDNTFESKLAFEYDNNKNCTTVSATNLTFSNEQFTSVYKYVYDNNPNPLYLHFKDNYIASLIIHTRSLFLDIQLRNLIRTFGKNNHIQTIFPDGTPENGKFSYEYKYNSAKYPEKVTTKNIGIGATTVETEFFYK
ncbi:hypothetical protein A8C32_08620 [Flavivirga aquatica]|uniref:DUF4595 domain-containing protein n=1 Tax=Flavivirga aquatica TaxID=1849968 RepID=A0A1E5SJD9_9FLAO|nr:hypothetical protein [Flavivirga aquatica]OEJ99223.1 hypothetical protein A8C32_08620 [Flavivirga aquatica]